MPADSILKIIQREHHYRAMAQEFVLVNGGSKAPTEFKLLKRRLAQIGVTPIHVTMMRLFFTKKANYLFFFDVKTDAERQRVAEKLYDEKRWTRIFSESRFSSYTPFFAKSMSLWEVFQTMMIASRIHVQRRTSPPREPLIWSYAELRKTLEDDDVMRNIKAKLNDVGKVLLAKYQHILRQ